MIFFIITQKHYLITGESEVISFFVVVLYSFCKFFFIYFLPHSVKFFLLFYTRGIPRELVKSKSHVVNGNGNSIVTSNGFHGDFGLGDEPDLATRADSDSSEDQSSRSSHAASALRTRPKISSSNGENSVNSVHSDDQKSNGQTENNKKARGFNIEKENSDSNMGNFVFVQGTNSVASKSRQSGSSVKYEEEYGDDDDKHLKNDAESEDVSQEDAAAKEENN